MNRRDSLLSVVKAFAPQSVSLLERMDVIRPSWFGRLFGAPTITRQVLVLNVHAEEPAGDLIVRGGRVLKPIDPAAFSTAINTWAQKNGVTVEWHILPAARLKKLKAVRP